MYERFKQLGKDSLIYGVGTVVSKAINFLLIPVYTRVFSPELYGVLDVLIISTTVIVILADMGLSAALSMFYYRAKNEEERKTIITSNFVFYIAATLLIVVLMVAFSRNFSEIIFNNEAYSNYLIVAAITILFANILNFCATVYRLGFKPIHYFYITLGNVILSVVLSIYFVLILKTGLYGALFGILFSAIIFTLISLYLTRQNFSSKFSIEKLKEMIKIGLPLAPVGIGFWIIDYSSRYFLVQFQDLSQVGLYAVGYRLAGILGLVIAGFRLANVPHQFSVSLDDTAKRFYSKTLTYYFIVTSFLVVFVSVFSREILALFTTPEYIEGYKAIMPLAFSFLFIGIYHLIGVGLILTCKAYFLSLGAMVGVAGAILLNIILVPKIGFLGAAYANALAYFIGLIPIYFWAQKNYPVNYELRKLSLIFVIAAILIFAGYLVDFGTVLNVASKAVLLAAFLFSIKFFLDKSETEKVKIFFNSFKKILLRK